ncbi:hypothetical protein K1T71_014052 [Dendrolimus kikuchii]|uniref:Uncharacterized protein n=1 Tax=Dendrolimus kikuchii TaxID=765133 RepID=A0ACC1CF81_9NEOP|nr:hypothetical protein K1T71_014052 [Dendrolimus kikuchii]
MLYLVLFILHGVLAEKNERNSFSKYDYAYDDLYDDDDEKHIIRTATVNPDYIKWEPFPRVRRFEMPVKKSLGSHEIDEVKEALRSLFANRRLHNPFTTIDTTNETDISNSGITTVIFDYRENTDFVTNRLALTRTKSSVSVYHPTRSSPKLLNLPPLEQPNGNFKYHIYGIPHQLSFTRTIHEDNTRSKLFLRDDEPKPNGLPPSTTTTTTSTTTTKTTTITTNTTTPITNTTTVTTNTTSTTTTPASDLDKSTTEKAADEGKVATTTKRTQTAEPKIDINALVNLIANLTYEYEMNLTQEFNETLHKYKIPTCPSVVVTTTTEHTTTEYFANSSIIAKCFVCGLSEPGLPTSGNCGDAFATDFMPLVPIDPRARGQVTRYRKYCRYLDIPNYFYNETIPHSIFGRWTGGCAVRWTDLTNAYTQRTCRQRRHPTTGRHFGSKRMAKLELALKDVDNGCLISPMATLLPLSRGISLYARFHACVCTGSWCNKSIDDRQCIVYTFITSLCVLMFL